VNLPPTFAAGDLIVFWIGWNNDTAGGPGTFVVPPATAGGPGTAVVEAFSWDRLGESAGLWWFEAEDDETAYPATIQWVHDAAAGFAAVSAAFNDHGGANLDVGVQVTDPASPTQEGVSDGLTFHRWRAAGGTPDVADVVPIADVRVPSLGLSGLHLIENAATPITEPGGWTLIAHADHSASTNPDQHTLLAYAVDFGDTSGDAWTYSSGTAPTIALSIVNGPFIPSGWVVGKVAFPTAEGMT
jgi:hypothetical protein